MNKSFPIQRLQHLCINKERVDTLYLCYLVHVCDKFIYSDEQGNNLEKNYLIDYVDEFFRLEATHKLNELLTKEMTQCL